MTLEKSLALIYHPNLQPTTPTSLGCMNFLKALYPLCVPFISVQVNLPSFLYTLVLNRSFFVAQEAVNL